MDLEFRLAVVEKGELSGRCNKPFTLSNIPLSDRITSQSFIHDRNLAAISAIGIGVQECFMARCMPITDVLFGNRVKKKDLKRRMSHVGGESLLRK